MGLNKKAMMMKVACVVLFLVAFPATVEAGRFDADTFLCQMFKNNGEPNYVIKSTTTACCNACLCNKRNPPQCHCQDVGKTCHSACKFCICALIYPRQCHCLDTTTFCYPPCSSSAKPQMIVAN